MNLPRPAWLLICVSPGLVSVTAAAAGHIRIDNVLDSTLSSSIGRSVATCTFGRKRLATWFNANPAVAEANNATWETTTLPSCCGRLSSRRLQCAAIALPLSLSVSMGFSGMAGFHSTAICAHTKKEEALQGEPLLRSSSMTAPRESVCSCSFFPSPPT
ncbi:hypothetical protein LZ31DRAFT_120437 [Colletotrichum somersetense]|nr:hypothetical protein LZ31DRAFT_120437 [Colletotrichum somersetense]